MHRDLPQKNYYMRKIIGSFIALFLSSGICAQELYVSTEPASNMATGSIGLRLNSKFFKMLNDGKYTYRIDPEIMFGVSKKLMLHLNVYGSNMYQPQFRMEGASVYAKYRFVSMDDVHSHFRMATFGKISLINNPTVLQTDQKYYFTNGNGQVEEGNETKYYHSDEIDLDGNNSGFLAGIVATQLTHKLALSSTVCFVERLDNLHAALQPGQSSQAINYTLSGGYLFLPRIYKDYKQTNFNLYFELLGSAALDKKAYYIDAAPAVQFIFNSISRLDISYRTQIAGNMLRLSESYFLLRFEYNLLNIFANRK
jgi:hypothetical protein